MNATRASLLFVPVVALALVAAGTTFALWRADKPGALIDGPTPMNPPHDPNRPKADESGDDTRGLPAKAAHGKPAPIPAPAAAPAPLFVESKPVKSDGVEFEAVVEPTRHVPRAGEVGAIDLGFRITNRGKKTLLLVLNHLDPIVTTADGKVLEDLGRNFRSAYAAPVRLAPGESGTVLWRGLLDNTRPGDPVQFRYTDGTAFGHVFEPVKPGKYRLSFGFGVEPTAVNTVVAMGGELPKELSVWTGTLKTEAVEFEVLPEAAAGVKDVRRLGVLLAELESADGGTRVAATKDLFDRGADVVAELEAAGAKPIAPGGTINPRRLDVVYSLLKGLPEAPKKAGFRDDSFGLHLASLQTRDDVVRMGTRHGFTLSGEFNTDGRPNCYVVLDREKNLAAVMRAVLASEPRVVTVNLNYVEK